jgi:hypothetical protein
VTHNDKEDEMKLTITVTPTADGKQEYVQIMSEDMFSINVVLIADEIEVRDSREVSP